MSELTEQEKRELRLKEARHQRTNDLKHVLSSLEGRRVMGRLVYEFGALQTLGYDSDARQHAFNDGTRAVGIGLFRDLLHADRDGWKLMVDEYHEAVRREPVSPAGVTATE